MVGLPIDAELSVTGVSGEGALGDVVGPVTGIVNGEVLGLPVTGFAEGEALGLPVIGFTVGEVLGLPVGD